MCAVVACVFLAASGSSAHAQTNYTWNLSTSGTNWGDANRWTGAGTQLTSASNWGNLDFTTYNAAAFNNLTSGTVQSITGTTNGLTLSGSAIELRGNVTRGRNLSTWNIPIFLPTEVSSTWTLSNAQVADTSVTAYSGNLTGSGTLVFQNTLSQNGNARDSFNGGTSFAGTFIQNGSRVLIVDNMGSAATIIGRGIAGHNGVIGGVGVLNASNYQSAYRMESGAIVFLNAGRTTTVSGSVTIAGVYDTANATFNTHSGAGNPSNGGRQLFITGNVGESGGARNVFTAGNEKGVVVFSGSNSWTGTTGANGSGVVFTRPLAVYQGGTASWTPDKFRNGTAMGIDPGGFTIAEQDAFLSAVTGSYSGIGSNGWQSGAAFALYSATSSTFSRVLTNVSGSTTRLLGLTKYGTGEVVITNTNNTYTGVTRVTDGTLSITSFGNGGVAGSIGQASSAAGNLVIGQSRDVNTEPGASVLRYIGSGETTNRSFTLHLSGVQNQGGSATLEASGSGELIMTGTGVELTSGAGASNFYLGGTNTGTNVLGTRLANTATPNLSLQKIGLGTWKLTGTNAIRGGVTVSSGKLILGNTAASGTNASSISLGLVSGQSAGGTTTAILGLDFTGTLAQAISLSATNTAIEALAGQMATVSGAVSGAFPLVKVGTGTLAFSGSNTYTGTTTVAEGQLRLTGSFGLTGGIGFNAVAGGSSALVIGTGTSSGVLGLAANNFGRGLGTTGSQVQVLNGGFAAYGADRSVTLGAASTAVTWNGANANFMGASGTFVLGAADADGRVIFANELTGTGAGVRNLNIVAGTTGTAAEFTNTLTISSTTTLRKIGSGLLLLSGSTVGSGTFDVAAGTLKFGSGSAAAGSGRFLVSSTSSTLDLNGNTLSAATVGLSAGQVLGGVDSTRLDISNVTDTASISGEVTGGGALTKGGAGRLTLSSSNSYNGTMTVDAGEMVLNSGDGLRNAAVAGSSGSVSFGTGVTAARFGALDGSAAVSLTNAGSGAVTLTLGSSGTYGGVISGAGGLVVQNIRQRLDGVSTFTGETLIGTGGELALGPGGSLASSATITVGGSASTGAPTLDLQLLTNTGTFAINAGQTLRGRGRIVGVADIPQSTLVMINGLLSPGNSPGTLTFDQVDVALGPQSNTLMEITGLTQGTQYDFVNLINGGNLTYGGTMELNFSQTFESGTFDLFSFAGSSGSFDRVVATGAYTGTFANNGSGVYTLSGSQTMTFTQEVSGGGGGFGQLVIVPEPLTLGLLGIGSGVAVLGLRRHRRRRGASAERG